MEETSQVVCEIALIFEFVVKCLGSIIKITNIMPCSMFVLKSISNYTFAMKLHLTIMV